MPAKKPQPMKSRPIPSDLERQREAERQLRQQDHPLYQPLGRRQPRRK